MQFSPSLDRDEKNVLQFTLPLLSQNFDLLTKKFYEYFLKTEAGELFKGTHIEKQFKMFSESINILLTQIANSSILTDSLDNLIEKHKKYGVEIKHIDLFTDSFVKALEDVFSTKAEARTIKLWAKIINEIMNYYKKQIE